MQRVCLPPLNWETGTVLPACLSPWLTSTEPAADHLLCAELLKNNSCYVLRAPLLSGAFYLEIFTLTSFIGMISPILQKTLRRRGSSNLPVSPS